MKYFLLFIIFFTGTSLTLKRLPTTVSDLDFPPTVSVLDYGAVGNGTHNDDTAVVNALAYLSSQGGGALVFPPSKIYRINHSNTVGESEYVISIPANITIQATGAQIGKTSDGQWCFRTIGDNINFTGGLLKKGSFEITSSCVTVFQTRSDSAWDHAFHLSSGKSNLPAFIHKIYKNITLANCYAFHPNRHGFAMHRGPYGFTGSDSQYLGEYININFINDTSIGAGYSLLSPFDYGFGMENIIAAHDVFHTNCYSSLSQGSGYHIEFQIVLGDINYTNCYAGHNGVAQNSGYPYGFMYRDAGVTYTNCQTDSNWGGAWVQIFNFTSGSTKWVNCNEKNFATFSYDNQSINNQKFVTNFPASAAINNGKIFLGGALNYPMYGLHTDLISVKTISEIYWDTATSTYLNGSHYAATTNSLVFDNATWVTSIGLQPIKIVDTTKQYKVSVVVRTTSGTVGSPYLYVQEYNSHDTLLNVAGHHYTIQSILAGVTSDTARLFTVTFGHGTTHPFQPTTQWVKVSLSEAELNTFNKFYSLSQFYCVPL